MHEETILTTIIVVFGLIFVASNSAIVVKRARFRYTIRLLLVGILIGYLSSRVEILVPNPPMAIAGSTPQNSSYLQSNFVRLVTQRGKPACL